MANRSLEQVVEALLAVAGGAATPVKLARALKCEERHGRWLLEAGAALGLLSYLPGDPATVTSRGARVLGASSALQRTARLRHALRQNPSAQRMLAFLEQQPLGCTARKLEDIVGTGYDLPETAVEERTALLLAWMLELELITEQGGVVRPVDGLAKR